MQWQKVGRIITPDKRFHWMQSHAMVPTPLYLGNNIYRIYFSGRDSKNRSHIGYCELNIDDPFRISKTPLEPVLSPGELGCFDDNGVTPASIVRHNDLIYMYYIGWRPRSTTRMSLMPGLAISDDNGLTFRRHSKAPILRLTHQEPISILTAPCVLRSKDLWQMWYVSGTCWVHSDLPKYNIKYAESYNGIDWNQTGLVCIDHQDDSETSLARPWVIYDNDTFKMWFSYKRPPETYRCGYAESKDGKSWKRIDSNHISVSTEGWDSEMVEYFTVFKHDSKLCMMYNGNGYGHSGAGLATAIPQRI